MAAPTKTTSKIIIFYPLLHFYYIFWDIFEHLQKLVWNLDSITWNITVLKKVTESVSILNFRAKINRIVFWILAPKLKWPISEQQN